MRMKCVNPKCREELYCGWSRQQRVGRWFCPSCRRIGRDALIVGGIVAGVLLKVGEFLLRKWGVL